jgi:hypothetical protein
VVVIKNCQGDVYQMYCDEQVRYGHNDFCQFMDIMDLYNDALHHVWVIEPTSRLNIQHFSFMVGITCCKCYTLTRCLN